MNTVGFLAGPLHRKRSDNGLGLDASPSQLRYRATYKDSLNEAELPRSELFAAPDCAAAKTVALDRKRANEIVVDVVPLG